MDIQSLAYKTASHFSSLLLGERIAKDAWKVISNVEEDEDFSFYHEVCLQPSYWNNQFDYIRVGITIRAADNKTMEVTCTFVEDSNE